MNAKGITLFAILFLLSLTVFSQKPIRVKNTYTYAAHENETTADAERIALQRAKIEIIEKTFGLNVSETSSGIISTVFDEEFFSAYSQTAIKGEWIETIGEPIFEYDWDNRKPIITCTVEGMIREINGIRTDFEAKVLKISPSEKFESRDFEDGDAMFLYFRSPIGGYLNIFLLCPDDDSALCLLPYRDSMEGTFRVEADTEYFLFSKDRCPDNPDLVDEYNLSTERSTEFNDLLIIFSTENFVKANLKVKKDDITAIKETSIDKFNSWMAKLQTKHNNITSRNIPIKISRK